MVEIDILDRKCPYASNTFASRKRYCGHQLGFGASKTFTAGWSTTVQISHHRFTLSHSLPRHLGIRATVLYVITFLAAATPASVSFIFVFIPLRCVNKPLYRMRI